MKRFILCILALTILFGACSKNTNDIQENAITEGASVPHLTLEEARERMNRKDGHVVVDVRREDEYERGHVPGAICISNEAIAYEANSKLPEKEGVILLYGRNESQSRDAAQKLLDMGYSNVYEFGGITDWRGELVTGSEPGVYWDENTVPDIIVSFHYKQYSVELDDSETARQFARFVYKSPFGVLMNDHEGKEKRAKLTQTFDADFSENNAYPGDILLYPGNIIAISYRESHGEFIKIGHILQLTTGELQLELGEREVAVSFLPEESS